MVDSVDVHAIPAPVIRNLSLGLLDVMLRIKKDDPDMWARIKARGKEIDEGGDDTYGSR
jgi:hypothetical protein